MGWLKGTGLTISVTSEKWLVLVEQTLFDVGELGLGIQSQQDGHEEIYYGN